MDQIKKMFQILSILLIFYFINYSYGSEILNIDPLSISVDSQLYRLCWKQIGKRKIDKLIGYIQPQDIIQFNIFKDSSNDKTHCIERKDKNSLYTVKIPILENNPNITLDFNVNFSLPLGPGMEIIRAKAAPKGIYFQLNAEFAGVYSNYPACKVLLLYKTTKTEKAILFDMDSYSKQKEYIQINDTNNFIIYYSCSQFNFFIPSTKVISYGGQMFNNDITEPLQPLIFMPFRKFVLLSWKHPTNIPDMYKIIIKVNTVGKSCLKTFRIFNRNKISVNWRPQPVQTNCENDVVEEDLGFFNGSKKGQIFVVLNIMNILNMNIMYKLSIFWLNQTGQTLENFVHFSPMPNENSGIINRAVFDSKYEYEYKRNQIPDIHQTVISENDANPIFESFVNASTFNDMTILTSVSQTRYPKIGVIQQVQRNVLINKCKQQHECHNGFYPFFYVLFTIENNDKIHAEIVEIPKSDGNYSLDISVNLLANNASGTFTVSWTLNTFPDIIVPSIYVIQMKDKIKNECYHTYIVKCRTCNTMYNKISEQQSKNFIDSITKHCTSIMTVDNHFEAAEKYINITTKPIRDSVIFIAELFSMSFSRPSQLIRSNTAILSDNKIYQIENVNFKLLISIISGFLITILFVVGLIYFIRRKGVIAEDKKGGETSFPADDNSSNIYDQDGKADETYEENIV